MTLTKAAKYTVSGRLGQDGQPRADEPGEGAAQEDEEAERDDHDQARFGGRRDAEGDAERVSRTRWTRVAAITVAALAAWSGAVAAPARAAATNLNSCQYSYDGYWRDMDVTLAGTPSVAGATITVGNQSVDAALPEWLAEYGYNFGLLQSGRNELPVKVWLAVRGTNTTQGVQMQAIETIAETTITTASGQFVSATPIDYSIPALGSQQWTARGGPVDFRQAGSNSLPPLPVGPGGRLQQPKGSLYILATLGEATFGLDCVPGSFIAQGAERVEATAQSFASVQAPSFSCLSALPAATNVAPVTLDFARERGLPVAHAGQPYAYAPTVDYRLPSAYLRDLFDAGRLAEGNNTVDLRFTGAVNGSTLTGDAQAVVNVSDGGATIGDLTGSTRLTAWTGTPTDGARIRARDARAADRRRRARPGPAVRLAVRARDAHARGWDGQPAVAGLREREGVRRGRRASGVLGAGQPGRGRPGPLRARAVPARSVRDRLPRAVGHAARDPDPTATATAAPSVAPTAVPTAVPTGARRRRPSRRARPRWPRRSSRSRRRGWPCRCAAPARPPAAGRLRLRTASKVRVGKRSKVVTLTSSKAYSLAAGKSASVKLTLSKDGRSVLKARRSLKVTVELRPADGKVAVRQLTLRR